MANEDEKQVAARASLQFVQDGQVLGLGTGSTAEYFIRLLAERVRTGLKIRGIPTSVRSRQLAEQLQIPLVTLEDCPEINIAIDGADEIDPQLRLIKGGGGALLREKIVASAAQRFIIVGDSSKQVSQLGKFPLPVEIVPFAECVVAPKIVALGATVALRKYAYGNPFRTDEGHYILDCQFGKIADPDALAQKLSNMPGVVEHGLFIGMAERALIGKKGQLVELKRP